MQDKQYTQKQYDVYQGIDSLNIDFKDYGKYVKPEYGQAYDSLSLADIHEMYRRVEEYGYYNHIQECDIDDIADRHDNDLCYALN